MYNNCCKHVVVQLLFRLYVSGCISSFVPEFMGLLCSSLLVSLLRLASQVSTSLNVASFAFGFVDILCYLLIFLLFQDFGQTLGLDPVLLHYGLWWPTAAMLIASIGLSWLFLQCNFLLFCLLLLSVLILGCFSLLFAVVFHQQAILQHYYCLENILLDTTPYELRQALGLAIQLSGYLVICCL